MPNVNEPDAETWMPFLYDECDVATSARLQQQLDVNPELRETVEGWRRTMRQLDSWKEAPIAMPRAAVSMNAHPRKSWLLLTASAACVLLAFVAGQSLAARSPEELASLRSNLKEELVKELRSELLQSIQHEVEPAIKAQLSALPGQETLRPLIETESARIMNAAVATWSQQDSVERQRMQRLLSNVLQNQMAMRTDLENLAIEAERQILRTRSEMVRLSGNARSQVREEVRTKPSLDR